MFGGSLLVRGTPARKPQCRVLAHPGPGWVDHFICLTESAIEGVIVPDPFNAAPGWQSPRFLQKHVGSPKLVLAPDSTIGIALRSTLLPFRGELEAHK